MRSSDGTISHADCPHPSAHPSQCPGLGFTSQLMPPTPPQPAFQPPTVTCTGLAPDLTGISTRAGSGTEFLLQEGRRKSTPWKAECAAAYAHKSLFLLAQCPLCWAFADMALGTWVWWCSRSQASADELVCTWSCECDAHRANSASSYPQRGQAHIPAAEPPWCCQLVFHTSPHGVEVGCSPALLHTLGNEMPVLLVSTCTPHSHCSAKAQRIILCSHEQTTVVQDFNYNHAEWLWHADLHKSIQPHKTLNSKPREINTKSCIYIISFGISSLGISVTFPLSARKALVLQMHSQELAHVWCLDRGNYRH